MHAAHVVHLGGQCVALAEGVEEVAVGCEHPHGGMAAPLDRGTVAVRGGIVKREGVVAVGTEVVDKKAALQPAAPPLLPEERRGEVVEGTALEAGLEFDALAGPEGGLSSLHVEHVAGGQRLGREQRGLLLALAEADVGGVAVHVVTLEVPDGHAGLAIFAVYRKDHVGIGVIVLECPTGIVLVQPLVADVEVVVVARQPDVLRAKDVVVILGLRADRIVIQAEYGAKYVLNLVPAALRAGVADKGAVRLLPVTEYRHVSLGDDMRTRRIPVLAVDGDQRLLNDRDGAARRHSHIAKQLLVLKTIM